MTLPPRFSRGSRDPLGRSASEAVAARRWLFLLRLTAEALGAPHAGHSCDPVVDVRDQGCGHSRLVPQAALRVCLLAHDRDALREITTAARRLERCAEQKKVREAQHVAAIGRDWIIVSSLAAAARKADVAASKAHNDLQVVEDAAFDNLYRRFNRSVSARARRKYAAAAKKAGRRG